MNKLLAHRGTTNNNSSSNKDQISTYIVLQDVHEVHANRPRSLHDMLVRALSDLSDCACETGALKV